ncbi:substrate-binding periplasmic protein [Curvivirga sp.]|uniref:substrate-binding periplasmic protein n=1 Tax=Curvivirga sp. TaxID=2856848 RepID=UPI003B59683E
MFRLKALCLLFFIVGVSFNLSKVSASDLPKEITLSTTEWCPYTCLKDPSSTDQITDGLIVEYLTSIFEQLEIKLIVKNLPWSHAVRRANEGQEIDGLLAAVFEEAPDLAFTNVPTMTYQICMFTNDDTKWQFKPADTEKELLYNLQARKVGIINGYGYDPVFDRFAANSLNAAFIERVSDRNGLDILFTFLERHRIDAFLSNEQVIAWHLKNHAGHAKVKNVGCFNENPFFIGLNPSKIWTNDLLQRLDSTLIKPENQKLLSELITKYTH